MLAASVDLEVELEPVAFVEAVEARAFDRADMDEGIGLAVVAGQEAEAFLTVEELDRAGRLLAGQLALRRAAAVAAPIAAPITAAAFLDLDHVADDLQILRGNLAAAIDQIVGQFLPFAEAREPGAFDRADVHEHVLAAALLLDEAETLLAIEELDRAFAGPDDLGGHARSAATTTAAETTAAAATAKAAAVAAPEAAAAAAETTPAAAVTAAAVAAPEATASEPAAVTAKAAPWRATERIERVFAEPVALVATTTPFAPAAFVVTHDFANFPRGPNLLTRAGRRVPMTPGAREHGGNAGPKQGTRIAQKFAGANELPPQGEIRAICDIFTSRRSKFPVASLAPVQELRQGRRMDIIALLSDPATWLALLTLIALEVVLGIDNLIFIAVLSNKLPVHQQQRARRIGLALALIMRIGLLLLIGWLVTLTQPLFNLGFSGAPNEHGQPSFDTAFSGRDLILLVGGLFLLWKATKEIHHSMEPGDPSGHILDKTPGVAAAATAAFGAVIAQIIAIDLVFSIDSILTAVGMTDDVPIMVAAVVITVGIMMVAADPLARFIEKNPTLVMLALAFLVMIGAVLIADAFGVHVPKGYIYGAMGFSLGVELLNMTQRNRRARLAAKG